MSQPTEDDAQMPHYPTTGISPNACSGRRFERVQFQGKPFNIWHYCRLNKPHDKYIHLCECGYAFKTPQEESLEDKFQGKL